MAKRFTGSKINWTQLTSKLTDADRPNFQTFKARYDGYLRKVSALPEVPPKIDFAAYKSKIPIPGLVDTFQKQYEALSIPFPADNETAKINEAEKLVMAEAQKWIAESNNRIAQFKKELEDEESLIPPSEMTLQEYALAYPEEAFNPDKPTFWPHGEEDQITKEDEEWWEKRKKNLVGADH
uniref:ATP synthase subunit d, mitochondrial n=1 Tax=Cacopsylla melanoneura TaxID=428564 RepID=A0A8D8Q448_9HEMI